MYMEENTKPDMIRPIFIDFSKRDYMGFLCIIIPTYCFDINKNQQILLQTLLIGEMDHTYNYTTKG